MSEVIKSLGAKKISKKQKEQEYESLLEDPVTFSIDEILDILGPRHERI